jgi:co-chaperonin GroES (HSP10)
MTSAFDPQKIKSIKALQDHVLISDMNFKEKLSHGGIVIPNSDGKLEGIHPRWARVYAIGRRQKDIAVGQYVLVKHGRWTRGVEIEDAVGQRHTLRRIDQNDILLVSDDPMQDETIGRGLS